MMTRYKILRYALFSLLVLVCGITVVAQESYAAVLHVNYPGVDIQRAGTENWLPLAVGSVAPFGNGDQLRTNETGRAQIMFWDGAQTLILSNSVYRLETLTIEPNVGTVLVGRLTGMAVHQIDEPQSPLTYTLDLGDVVVTLPGRLFATWSRTGQPVSLTVAEGDVSLIADDTIIIQAGQGFFRTSDHQEVIDFAPPWNAAQMQGLIEGCSGMVNTIGAVPLKVRIGPGLGFVEMGGVEYEQPIQIMAINESRGWYRIPFLGGFGWLLRSAIHTDCQDLPMLPDTTVEDMDFVLAANADEIELLQPFFGKFIRNEWFYQWTATAP